MFSLRTYFLLSLTVTSLGSAQYGPNALYYLGIDGLTGEDLRTALHNLVDSHNTLSYTSTDEFMDVVDAAPGQPGDVRVLYSDQTMSQDSFGASGPFAWNREHTWPQSYGARDGDARSDLHALFPCNAQVNSSRGNKFYDWTTGSSDPLAPDSKFDSNSWEPRDEDKGRVARAAFYMALRYEGDSEENGTSDLELGNRPNSGSEIFGLLRILLRWNRMYETDTYEQFRNHSIFTGVQTSAGFLRQGNRNPFIDYPDLADAIFSSPFYISAGSWRVEHFTLNQLTDPAVSGDLADPDKDGRLNLLESALNLDPWSPYDENLPEVRVSEDGYTFVYRRIKQFAESGLRFTVEKTSSLGDPDWNPLEPNPGDATIVDLQLTDPTLRMEEVYLLDRQPTADRTFYRLRVERDPEIIRALP